MTAPYSLKKLQEAARAKNRVIIDREEYAALCALRDGAHEDLKASVLRLQNRYDGLLDVNREQLSRLQKYSLESDGLRANLKRLEDRDALMAARVSKLETELAEARRAAAEHEAVKAELEQTRSRLVSAYPATFETQPPNRK